MHAFSFHHGVGYEILLSLAVDGLFAGGGREPLQRFRLCVRV